MKRAKIKHSLVVNNGKLVGIITETDSMSAVPLILSIVEAVCCLQK